MSVFGSRRRVIVGVVLAIVLAVAGSILSSPASADTDESAGTDESTTTEESTSTDESGDSDESADPDGSTTDMIDVPVGEPVAKGNEGDVVVIGGADVNAEFVGRTCNLEVVVTNQESVHPGNVLIVSSDGSSATVTGIEDAAGTVTTQGGTLTLGETVALSVQLGPDGISSLGSNLTVTCEELAPTPPAAPVAATPQYTG